MNGTWQEMADSWETGVAGLSTTANQKQVGGYHYKDMCIQPVDFIEANKIPFIEGSAIKYICRHSRKNGAEDIKKAIHFLELLLEKRYGKG